MKYIIETFDLTKEFNGLVAVDSINFKVKEGEIFGFLGPNGAGKTTTINMLTTLIKPTKGTALVNGYDILKEPHEVRRSIGVVPQESVLESELTARENLKFHAELYKIPKKDIEKRIDEVLKLVGLEKRANDKVATFSGGMRRRLEIVRAFLHKPRIIFMDEPTIGLDPQTRRVIWDYIRKINKEEGITIFLTTHYMEEAEELCDRVCIIDRGRILDIDTPENLKKKIGEGDVIEVEVTNKKKFLNEIESFDPKILREGKIRIYGSTEDILPEIIKACERVGSKILHLSVREPTLEDVFIHYTGRQIRESIEDSTMKNIVRRFIKR